MTTIYRPLISLLILGFLGAGASGASPEISVREDEQRLELRAGDAPVLTYHKATVQPPAGADAAFARSGFIHPLHAPSGAVVTGIHPDDHIHHLGLWHAWVNSKHGTDEPDFWNLKEKTGAVRFSRTLALAEAGFEVEQEHVKFVDGANPVVVLREVFSVSAEVVDGAYVIDYGMEQTNVTGEALELPAYRYGGGIAFRGPAGWDAGNSGYLTSEGKVREDSHATRANWCAMWGAVGDGGDGGDATVAILCHPENRDAPQRVRTWPEGKVFFNYVPVQESGWEIGPGETVTLRYRLVVGDGKPDAGELDARWSAYAGEGG
ncbi:hypothetical protein BH23VER1_BH23VER1_15150 [soil metagenome]